MYGTIPPLFPDIQRSPNPWQNKHQRPGQWPAAPQQPQLALQKIYVKDVSFEAPNAPRIFRNRRTDQPQVQLNLGQKATPIGDDSV